MCGVAEREEGDLVKAKFYAYIQQKLKNKQSTDTVSYCLVFFMLSFIYICIKNTHAYFVLFYKFLFIVNVAR